MNVPICALRICRVSSVCYRLSHDTVQRQNLPYRQDGEHVSIRVIYVSIPIRQTDVCSALAKELQARQSALDHVRRQAHLILPQAQRRWLCSNELGTQCVQDSLIRDLQY